MFIWIYVGFKTDEKKHPKLHEKQMVCKWWRGYLASGLVVDATNLWDDDGRISSSHSGISSRET